MSTVKSPLAGAAGAPLISCTSPTRADYQPEETMAGTHFPIPPSRDISNKVCHSPNVTLSDRSMSSLVYIWAQFVESDLMKISTGSTAVPGEYIPRAQAIPGDPASFDSTGSRSQLMTGSHSGFRVTRTGSEDGTLVGFRESPLVNQVTHYLDASMVYGNGSGSNLRSFVDGTLDIVKTTGNSGSGHLEAAGDASPSDNIVLVACKALFVREHNRRCVALKAANPTWDDEHLYQSARRYVIALIQKITYEDFLPALIGHKLEPYSGYVITADPRISVEFATAGFPLALSMTPNIVEFLDKDGIMHHSPAGPAQALSEDQLLGATTLVERGAIEPLLKYASSSHALEVDTFVDEGPRSLPMHDSDFSDSTPTSLDFAAMAIQQGRDRGLPDYNTMREAYGLRKHTDFNMMSTNPRTVARLRDAYPSVDSIDPWVGALAEDHVAGGSLGALHHAIVSDQFTRLRDGDSWWFENPGVLDLPTLSQIKATTWADVVKRNTMLTDGDLQDDCFFFITAFGGVVYNDINGDGKRQLPTGGVGGEDAVPNVNITILELTDKYGRPHPAPERVATAVADANGVFYVQEKLALAEFGIVVESAPGFERTTPTKVRLSKGGVKVINLGLTPTTMTRTGASVRLGVVVDKDNFTGRGSSGTNFKAGKRLLRGGGSESDRALEGTGADVDSDWD